MPNILFGSLRPMVKENKSTDWSQKATEPTTTLGQRIAIARQVMGLTATGLAKAAKVTKAAVSDWESGKTKNLRLENLFYLCDLLNVNARWLATGQGVPTRQLVRSEQESELLVIFRDLNKASQEALIGVARAMHTQESGGKATRVNPFKEPITR